MNRFLFAIIVFCCINTLCAQQSERHYLNPSDTSGNFYTVFYPPALPWKGYLILIPGFGESPEDVLQQTDLPLIAARNGLLTVIPTLQDGVLSFGVDDQSQTSLAEIISHVEGQHKLEDKLLYIGGFSWR